MEFVVQSRLETGKSINRRLRAAGMCSGVIYGKTEPVFVKMPANKTLKLVQDIHGAHVPLNLTIQHEDGKEEKRQVILQEFQKHSYKNIINHVDFREVDDESTLKINVPIRVTGVSKAVKLGGTMQIIRHEISVRCKTKLLPEALEIDVTELDFGESIHVLDIPYPEGVKPIVSGRNFTLITLAGRMKEETAVEATEGEATAAEPAAS